MNKAGRYLLGVSIGLAGLAGITACHKTVSAAQQEAQQEQQGPDPSLQNMVAVDSAGNPINESEQQAAQPSTGGAPIERRAPEPDQSQVAPYDQQSGAQPNYAQDELYDGQDVSAEPPVYADQPPPELPVYEQPEAPGPNYMWTPGYWDYAPLGYYWVPGVWVMAPYPGALWTPCYWGFYGGRYRFYHGYWGLHIGFYGGINYGFGYFGEGYRGGYWNGNNFYYNRMLNRLPPRITNVYVRNVTVVNRGNRVAYNGGGGGLQVRPRPAEVAAMRAPRTPPMSTQVQFRQQASQNRQQFFNQNHGRPATVAAARPIAADKGIQRPAAVQPANGVRPGFQNGGQNRPAQPANVARPGYQGNENRPVQPGRGEASSVNRPQVQPTRPTPETRPASQSQVRPNTQYRLEAQQPRPQKESRPAPQQPRPNVQQPRSQNEPKPAPQQYRPQAQQYHSQQQVRTPPPPKPPPQHPAPAHTEPDHPR
jgi:WXXGXW repeat (2 copies)